MFFAHSLVGDEPAEWPAASAYIEAMSTVVAYFAHDLCDPAVERRIRMLEAGGAEVRPIGFRRGLEVPDRLAKLEVFDLGRTTDGRLVQRAVSIAHALVRLHRCANHVRRRGCGACTQS